MRQFTKNKLFFFLLKAILVFNVFSFSGYTGNAHSAIQTSTQSELVLDQSAKSSNQFRSFYQYNNTPPNAANSIDLKSIQKMLLRHYNKCIPIRFKTAIQKKKQYIHQTIL